MSASESTAATTTGDVAGDIWQQHESQIRDLYQKKKRTLKQVKEEMEKKGFPKKPRSTWESKLRVDLKIRKKNKAADWPLVYRHLVTRLETPGKKQLKQPTTVRLDGKEIPFEQAWKEIRRSGAHTLSPRLLPEGSLPQGVEVRTPSPVPSPPLITVQSNLSVPSTVSENSSSSTALQIYTPHTVTRSRPSRAMSAASSLFSGNLTTPWISLCLKLQTNIFHNGIATPLLDTWKLLEWWKVVPVGRTLRAHDIEGLRSRSEVVSATSPSFPRPSSDLGYRLAQSRGNISISEFVSTCIYLLSNRLHDSEDGDRGLHILCSLFEHDTQLFGQLLQYELPTGRATWESLFRYSAEHQHKVIFGFLLETGMRLGWLRPSDSRVLVSALAMDCPTNVVLGIIDYFARAGSTNHCWKHILEAISLSYGNGYLEVANMLVKTFDINAPMHSLPILSVDNKRLPVSVFLGFILGFDNTAICHWRLLDFFLSSSADVDRPLPSQWYPRKPSQRWYEKNEINRALRPTILDHSFRLDRSLFERLAQRSRASMSKLTKSGLIISLEKGPDAFQDYLRTRTLATHSFDWQSIRSTLEFLLLDQVNAARWNVYIPEMFPSESFYAVLVRVRAMDVKVVRSSIQCGVDLNKDSDSLPDISSVLNEVLKQLRMKFADDALQLLQILISKGADINEKHLEEAVEMDGTCFLEWLRPMVKDFPVKAAGALAKAASLNNFKAVQFLLQSGVNPNQFIKPATAGWRLFRDIVVRNINGAALEEVCMCSVQAIAAGVGRLAAMTSEASFERSTLEMIQFLSQRGARLVVGLDDPTPFAFLMLLFEKGRGDSQLFAKVKFALSAIRQNEHHLNPPACLLELCVSSWFPRTMDEIEERLKIFEYLLDEGADVNPGSPLAALTRFGGGKELLNRVLCSGANLDAYTAVTHRDGDWNHMTTPLQAAASKLDQDLVELYLMRGANVNSPARGTHGKTALQAVCSQSPATEEEHRRKMTICDLLLSSGAEVNAAPSLRYGVTALQAAVVAGDIELTATLIRNGAHINAPPSKHGHNCSALDFAARCGRLDITKLLLDANALSSHRGMTGYDGAMRAAHFSGNDAVMGLIRSHLVHLTEHSLNDPQIQEVAEDFHIYGYDAEDEAADDNYWNRRPSAREPSEQDGQSTDEESSETHTTECVSDLASVSQTRLARADEPRDAQAVPAMQASDDTLTGELVDYVGTGNDLNVGELNLQCENEHVPNYFMGASTDLPRAQALYEPHLVPNAAADDWLSPTGTRFDFTQEDMQLAGDEWMLHDSLGGWAGMPGDIALWPQVFEISDLDFGFSSFDPSRQLPPSDQLLEADTEGQAATGRDFIIH